MRKGESGRVKRKSDEEDWEKVRVRVSQGLREKGVRVREKWSRVKGNGKSVRVRE